MAQVYKNAGTLAARIAGEDPEMDRVAAATASKARALAAAHKNTGKFAASITTERIKGKRGVTDRAVSATDPAALHIELGHTAKNGRWVEGLHILGRAAGGD